MRIAIYSGSFNPIHNGHLAIADKVLAIGGVDELWFLVSPQNPLKSSAVLWPEEDRLAMVKLAVHEKPFMKASDYEFHLPRPVYTINTLNSLKSDYPQHDFVLLVGGDNLSIIHRWYQSQQIIDNYGLIVYPRPGYSMDLIKGKSNIQIIDAPFLDISATEIRKRILEGASIKDLVPVKVADYIQHKKW